jgi:hypothetical protein
MKMGSTTGPLGRPLLRGGGEVRVDLVSSSQFATAAGDLHLRITVSREVEDDTEACGRRFQPIRDPSRFPVCPRCKELAGMLGIGG